MKTRVNLTNYCDTIIEMGWLAALIIVPLFFNLYSRRSFEPDKVSLLHTIALVMVTAWLFKMISGGPAYHPLVALNRAKAVTHSV